jgi:hypothetical protein
LKNFPSPLATFPFFKETVAQDLVANKRFHCAEHTVGKMFLNVFLLYFSKFITELQPRQFAVCLSFARLYGLSAATLRWILQQLHSISVHFQTNSL